MKKIVLNVEGMSCSHCENAVKKAVTELDHQAIVNVDLSTGLVDIQWDEDKASREQLKEAIEDQGYDVEQTPD